VDPVIGEARASALHHFDDAVARDGIEIRDAHIERRAPAAPRVGGLAELRRAATVYADDVILAEERGRLQGVGAGGVGRIGEQVRPEQVGAGRDGLRHDGLTVRHGGRAANCALALVVSLGAICAACTLTDCQSLLMNMSQPNSTQSARRNEREERWCIECSYTIETDSTRGMSVKLVGEMGLNGTAGSLRKNNHCAGNCTKWKGCEAKSVALRGRHGGRDYRRGDGGCQTRTQLVRRAQSGSLSLSVLAWGRTFATDAIVSSFSITSGSISSGFRIVLGHDNHSYA